MRNNLLPDVPIITKAQRSATIFAFILFIFGLITGIAFWSSDTSFLGSKEFSFNREVPAKEVNSEDFVFLEDSFAKTEIAFMLQARNRTGGVFQNVIRRFNLQSGTSTEHTFTSPEYFLDFGSGLGEQNNNFEFVPGTEQYYFVAKVDEGACEGAMGCTLPETQSIFSFNPLYDDEPIEIITLRAPERIHWWDVSKDGRTAILVTTQDTSNHREVRHYNLSYGRIQSVKNLSVTVPGLDKNPYLPIHISDDGEYITFVEEGVDSTTAMLKQYNVTEHTLFSRLLNLASACGSKSSLTFEFSPNGEVLHFTAGDEFKAPRLCFYNISINEYTQFDFDEITQIETWYPDSTRVLLRHKIASSEELETVYEFLTLDLVSRKIAKANEISQEKYIAEWFNNENWITETYFGDYEINQRFGWFNSITGEMIPSLAEVDFNKGMVGYRIY